MANFSHSVTGEIFPLKIRAKALSMTTASNWILNFALSFSTPYLVDSGPGNANLGTKVFFIWGGFNLLAVAFVYMLIYETKGLSLEQVDDLYNVCGKAWKSKKYVSDNMGAGTVSEAARKAGVAEGLAETDSDSEKGRGVAHVERRRS